MRQFSRTCIALLAIAGLLAGLIPPVRADTTIMLTTTADFDSGTKSQANLLQNHFAMNGVSQPNNFINYPSAEFYNGRTYIAYQGPDSTGNAHHPSPYVTYYDHASATWGPIVRVADATSPPSPIDDDHGAPAILIDASRYIHVFYGAHVSPLKHARSNNPEDISAWTVGTDPVSDRFTYSHPMLMGTDIYVLGRYIPAAGQGNTITVKSTDGGVTWGTITTVLNVDATNGSYVGTTEKFGTKIYFQWSTAERKHSYVAYLETATAHMFCKAAVSDVDLGTDINQTEADANCRVEGSGAKNADFGAVHLDSGGIPYTIYRLQDSGNVWNHRFSYWSGSAWVAPVTITVAKAQGNYADFIVNSATSIEAYLTASGFTGVGPGPILVDRGGDIEKWTWAPSTWTKASTVLAESTTAFTLNNVQIVRNFNAGLKVVFCENYVDNYAFDVSGSLKSYAFDGTNFVKKPWPPGENDVETLTDSPQVAAGGAQLASGLGDTFGVPDADAITRKWHLGRYISASDGGYTRADVSTKTAGQLYLRLQTGTGTNDAYGIVSEASLSGDFDIRIKPTRIENGATAYTFFFGVLNENRISAESSATIDGILYGQFWQIGTGGDRRFSAYTVTNGVKTCVGPCPTQFTGVNSFDRNMRVTRAGNTITWYYNATGSQTWTQDFTTTFAFSGSSRVVMYVNANSGRITEWNADDFQFVSTNLDAGGYRTSGSWTSPILLTTTNLLVANKIVVGAANLTSTNTLMVELFDSYGSSGKYGPFTSGSTLTILPGVAFQGNISARVYLTGNGASTPSLLDIAVTFGDFNPAQVSLVPIFFLFGIWAFLLALGTGAKEGIFVFFSGLAAIAIGLFVQSTSVGLPTTFITVIMGGIGLFTVFVGLLAMAPSVRE